MSDSVQKTIVCPHCGQKGEAQTWPVVDAFEDPEAADALLSGTLFDYTCAGCNTTFTLDFDVIYVDDYARGRVRYARRAEDRADEERLVDEMPAPSYLDPDDDRPYTSRIVDSRDALREKAALFRDGLDDRAVELIKASAFDLFESRGEVDAGDIVRYGGQTEDGALLLEFIGDAGVRETEVPRSSYDALVARELPADDVVVDAAWAQRAARDLSDQDESEE